MSDYEISRPPTTNKSGHNPGQANAGSAKRGPIKTISSSTTKPLKSTPLLVLSDELGKLIEEATTRLSSSATFEDFVRQTQGPSDLHSNVEHLDHPAADLLKQYRDRGVPMETTTDPWTSDRIQAALDRGPHQSANLYKDFVREEFVNFVKKHFWTIVPARLVKHLKNLRLSPLGVVPQHERRPRLICDYTFYGVNQETHPLAPEEAMQFGKALSRVLERLAYANPRFGPVYMSKIDISDGFYRLRLTWESVVHMGLLLPKWENEEQMVAFPMVLPMGWTESPPAFCAATETIADLANWSLYGNETFPPHRLEELANTLPKDYTEPDDDSMQGPLSPRKFADAPIAYVDVYVDDIGGLGQGQWKEKVNRTIFHSIDKVLRPLVPDDSAHRQEPASESKLRKGDGCMATQKVYLGWLIDTRAMTIQLTTRRRLRLKEILSDLPRTRQRVSVKTWHKVLGELRSMALAIPGSRGLFSALQFRFKADKTRIRLTRMVHDFLDDFRWLFQNLDQRPTRIYEVVPTEPQIVGATDASGLGMGGIFFVPTSTSTEDKPDYESYLWRVPFPDDIRACLVTFENPNGTITNSDLEMAATVGHNDVVAHKYNVAEITVQTGHDNVAALMWNRKGSTTTEGPAAYLLRLQSLHQRHYRYISLHDFIPGHLNRLADEASRRVTLSDSDLIAYFNTHYPQKRQWQLCHLRPEMLSALISALYNKRSTPQSWTSEPEPLIDTGKSGWPSVPRTPWILGSPKGTILSRTYKSSPSDFALDASHPVVNPFELIQLLTSYVPSHRDTNGWGPQTPV